MADSTASPADPRPANSEDSSMFSSRSLKQFRIFAAGCAFTLLGSLIIKRGVARRKVWARPTFFRPNNQHPEDKIDAPLEALEALTVATVNVFSWSTMIIGGSLWAADISTLDELRARSRVLLLSDVEQQESQQQVNEWIDAAKKPWNLLRSKKDAKAREDSGGGGGDSSSGNGSSAS